MSMVAAFSTSLAQPQSAPGLGSYLPLVLLFALALLLQRSESKYVTSPLMIALLPFPFYLLYLGPPFSPIFHVLLLGTLGAASIATKREIAKTPRRQQSWRSNLRDALTRVEIGELSCTRTLRPRPPRRPSSPRATFLSKRAKRGAARVATCTESR